jgi:hypothetical protein
MKMQIHIKVPYFYPELGRTNLIGRLAGAMDKMEGIKFEYVL